MKIVKENGKIYGIEENISYGVRHITKMFLGNDNKPKKKTKKKQKMDDEK